MICFRSLLCSPRVLLACAVSLCLSTMALRAEGLPADPNPQKWALPGEVTMHLTTCSLSQLDESVFTSLEHMLEGSTALAQHLRTYDGTRQVASVYIASLLGIPYVQTADFVDARMPVQVMVFHPENAGAARTWALVLPVRRFDALLRLWEQRERAAETPGQTHDEHGRMANPYFSFKVLDEKRSLARVNLTSGAPWVMKDTAGLGLVMARSRKATDAAVRALRTLGGDPLVVGKEQPHVRCAFDMRKIRAHDVSWARTFGERLVDLDEAGGGNDFPIVASLFRLPAVLPQSGAALALPADKAVFSARFAPAGVVLDMTIHPQDETPLASFASETTTYSLPLSLLRDLPTSTTLALGADASAPGVRQALRRVVGGVLNVPEAKSGVSTAASRALDQLIDATDGAVTAAYVSSRQNDLNVLVMAESTAAAAPALAANLSRMLTGYGQAAYVDGRLLMVTIGPSAAPLLALATAESRQRGSRNTGVPLVVQSLGQPDASVFALVGVDPVGLAKTVIGQVAMMMRMRGLPEPMAARLDRLRAKAADSQYPLMLAASREQGRLVLRAHVPSTALKEVLDLIELSAATLDGLHDNMGSYMLGESPEHDRDDLLPDTEGEEPAE